MVSQPRTGDDDRGSTRSMTGVAVVADKDVQQALLWIGSTRRTRRSREGPRQQESEETDESCCAPILVARSAYPIATQPVTDPRFAAQAGVRFVPEALGARRQHRAVNSENFRSCPSVPLWQSLASSVLGLSRARAAYRAALSAIRRLGTPAKIAHTGQWDGCRGRHLYRSHDRGSISFFLLIGSMRTDAAVGKLKTGGVFYARRGSSRPSQMEEIVELLENHD